MSRMTTKVLALVAASGMAVAGFFLMKPAFAATNGQQLQICQQPTEDYTEMFLQGTNQNGDFVSFPFAIAPGGCGNTAGHWWVGGVSVELRNSTAGAPSRSGHCEVPSEGHGLVDCFL